MQIKCYHVPRRGDHVLIESIGLRASGFETGFCLWLMLSFPLHTSIKHQEAILLKGKEKGMKEKGRNKTSRKQVTIVKTSM